MLTLRGALPMAVIEAQALAAKDPTGSSDPYCTLSLHESAARSKMHELRRLFALLLPRHAPYKTHTIPQCLDPVWREEFILYVFAAGACGATGARAAVCPVPYRAALVSAPESHCGIRHRPISAAYHEPQLRVQVWYAMAVRCAGGQCSQCSRQWLIVRAIDRDQDSLLKDDFLGQVFVPLSSVSAEGTDSWFKLQSESDRSPAQGRVHLRLQLRFTPVSTMTHSTDSLAAPAAIYECALATFIEHDMQEDAWQMRSSLWCQHAYKMLDLFAKYHAIDSYTVNVMCVRHAMRPFRGCAKADSATADNGGKWFSMWVASGSGFRLCTSY